MLFNASESRPPGAPELTTAAEITSVGGNPQAGLPPLIPREVLFGNPEKAGPQISPDGKLLAYLAPYQGVLNVWTRTVGRDDDRVATTDRKRPVRLFVWQGDSRHILFLQDNEGDENFHVFQTDLETNGTRDLTPFPGAKADVIAYDPKLPDTILLQINVRDPRLFDVYRLNPGSGLIELDTENPGDVVQFVADHTMAVRAAQVSLPDGGTEIRVRDDVHSPWRSFLTWGIEESLGGVVGFSPDNRCLWVFSSVDANALRLLEIDMATGTRTVLAEDPQFDVGALLTNPRTDRLEAVQFNRARNEIMLQDASLQADFDVLKATRDGDFWISSRDLADAHWVVSYNQINFRGSTGYGKAYLNAGNREWAGAMHTDLLDGRDWMIGQGIAAPNRVGIMGGSYGGYATLAALAYAPSAFACGVDLFGPSNLNTLLASIPPYWEPMKALFGKRMGEGEDFLNTQSPLFQAHEIKAPLLIAQGANDVRVRLAESDQIVEALRKNNQPVEYYVFPDEGHGFARPENQLKFSAVTEVFLAKYLGGRSEPASG